MTQSLEICAGTALTAAVAKDVRGADDVRAADDVRVGVDVVLVSDVLESVRAFGDSYLSRIYTAREQADCGADSRSEVSASRLAARFAAKEAVTKVLAPRDAPGWWRDIEVARLDSGACELRLHGAASAAAERLGLNGWGVSLTHEGAYAAAVVVVRTPGSSTEQNHREVEA